MLRARAALLGVLLVCAGVAAHQVHAPNLADFQVYDTAAALVHEHQSPHIYDDADTGGDPQLKFADPDTAFAQEAQRLGVPRVRLYVYPPILADLMVPFSWFPAKTGGQLWFVLNLSALVLSALLALGMVGGRWRSLGALALLVGLFSLMSTVQCLYWGQITIVLLLLWAAGIFFYGRGWHAASAVSLALATSIKLTPLLVVAPLLVWRDWKWLRAYIVALAGIVAVMLVVNGPALLPDYFLHVTPSMSRGIPNWENKSIPSEVQVFWSTLRGNLADADKISVPAMVVTAGKVASLVALVGVLAALLRAGRSLSLGQRSMALAAVALLSTCISPVSWKHAYEPVVLLLAFLWAHALRHPVSTAYLALLTLCSAELGSFIFDSVALKLFHGHGPLVALCAFLGPGAGILLCLLAAATLRRAPAGASAATA